MCQSKTLASKKNNSLNPWQLIIEKNNEESNGNKHLMLAFTDKSKEIDEAWGTME